MRSILGQCAECCEIPEPLLLSAVVTTSRGKSGWRGYTVGYRAGCGSNRYFLRTTLSGEVANGVNCPLLPSETYVYSGEKVYDPIGDSVSGRFIITDWDDNITVLNTGLECFEPCCSPIAYNTSLVASQQDVHVSAGEGICAGVYIGSEYVNLYEEYTTQHLLEVMRKKIPDYPDFALVAPIASLNVATDETGVSAGRSKYKFRHRVPKVGSGVKYRLIWFERFTPESGADPRDVGRTYLWDSVVPDDYDPEDNTTWPETEEYTIEIPAGEGTVIIGYLDADCNFIPDTAYALCVGDAPVISCPSPPANGQSTTTGQTTGDLGAGTGADGSTAGSSSSTSGLGFNPYAAALGFNSAAGSLGFNSSGGQLGFNPTGGQLGFNPGAGQLGFNPSAGSLGFNSSGGQLGFNPSAGQIGFNSTGGQLGFNSTGGQLGFNSTGGQLGFNSTGGQLGFNEAAGFLGFNSTLGVIGFLAAAGALGFNSSAGGLGFNAAGGSLGFNSAGGGLGFNAGGGSIGTIGGI